MTSPAAEQTIETGVQPGDVLLDKYRVDKIIGVGGMGYVVEAWHKVFEERVAIKLLLGSLMRNDEAMARFEREARLLFKLKSENVCRVIDYGQLDNGVPFMVMEHLDGQDLGAMLEKREPLPFDRCVDFALQACHALAHAHVRGIVHRDLKPENLFIVNPESDATLKLLDFGLSKIHGAGETATRQRKLTSKEQVMGTPQYMSPEQWLASKDVGAKTDQWALGVILFEMLTGRLPFEGEHLARMCQAILNTPTPLVTTFRADVPPGIDLVIHKALEKNPDDRYENVGSFAVALATFASPGATAKAERVLGMLQRKGTQDDSGQWSVIKRPMVDSDLSTTARRPPRISAILGQLKVITSTSWQRMLREQPQSRAALAVAALAILVVTGGGIWALARAPEPEPREAAAPVDQVVPPPEASVESQTFTTLSVDEPPSTAPSGSTAPRKRPVSRRSPVPAPSSTTKAKPAGSVNIFDERF